MKIKKLKPKDVKSAEAYDLWLKSNSVEIYEELVLSITNIKDQATKAKLLLELFEITSKPNAKAVPTTQETDGADSILLLMQQAQTVEQK